MQTEMYLTKSWMIFLTNEAFSMDKKILNLLKYISNENQDLKDKIISIAKKTERRRSYLVIDLLEMESIVDSEKVEPYFDESKIEVKL